MANDYYACMVKTTLILNAAGDALIADIPCDGYSTIGIYSGGQIINGSLSDLTNENADVIVYIHVKQADKAAIQAYGGYIGDTKAAVRAHADYIAFYPHTVGDNKNKYDDLGVLVEEYTGADKDDLDLFCEIAN